MQDGRQNQSAWHRVWRHWLRRAFSALSLLAVWTGTVSGQDADSLWDELFDRPATSANRPARPPVRFVWHDDEFTEPGETNPIRQAAFQNQYPLSKDSEDLLPREDHRYRFDDDSSDVMSPENRDGETDELFTDKGVTPWIEWKKTIGTATWIAHSTGGLGVTSLDARGSIEFPNFQALWFVPRVATHWLSGPVATDLPARLYDMSFETVGMLPIGDRWFVQAALAPSLFTDGHNTTRKALRLPGRLLAFWKYSETLTFVGGILYLDRDDVKALPSAGVLWNPNEDWKFELAAPRPRIARRISHDEDFASWGYVVGEFGGGTWAIQRANGLNDVATLSDYRLMAGYERKWTSGRNWLIEAGYVFSRTLKYTSTSGVSTNLPSTCLVRLGVTF